MIKEHLLKSELLLQTLFSLFHSGTAILIRGNQEDIFQKKNIITYWDQNFWYKMI